MKRLFSSILAANLALLAGSLSSPLSAGELWVNQRDASLVLGQADFDTAAEVTSQAGMNDPWDVAVDPTTGKVFVADSNHNRILRFASFSALSNGADAEVVIGQPDFTATVSAATTTNLFAPRGITVDTDGRLWVADFRNHRVLRFDDASNKATGAAADGVLGKANFTDDDSELSQTGIGFPYAVALDDAGNLFVGSSAHDRVLMFADAANLSDGAAATLVLGQDDFDTNTSAATIDRMAAPTGLVVDSSGNLFVADQGNHRILRFDDAANKTTGADADAVLGQPDFTTVTSGISATTLNGPRALTVSSDGTLWVADTNNNRIIGFPDPGSLPNGSAATLFLGQADLDSSTAGLSQNELDTPRGLSLDSTDRLYVADSDNNRVVVFEKGLFQPDLTIGEKSTQQTGNNRYNSSGSGQKKKVVTDRKEVKFIAKIENDGNIDDQYFVKSLKTSSKRRVKVFRKTGGRSNITSAAKKGTHLTAMTSPGATLSYELRVKPKGKSKKSRSNHKVWLDGSSAADGEKDRVIGFVKNRP